QAVVAGVGPVGRDRGRSVLLGPIGCPAAILIELVHRATVVIVSGVGVIMPTIRVGQGGIAGNHSQRAADASAIGAEAVIAGDRASRDSGELAKIVIERAVFFN